MQLLPTLRGLTNNNFGYSPKLHNICLQSKKNINYTTVNQIDILQLSLRKYRLFGEETYIL